MAEHSWSHAFPASIFEADIPSSTSSSLSQAVPELPIPSTSGSSSGPVAPATSAGPSHISSVSLHATPCQCNFVLVVLAIDFLTDSKHAQSKSVTPQNRNKFLEVKSPLMPRPVQYWDDTMCKVGATFNHSACPLKGIPSGYILPEPALFAYHSDDVACQSYMQMYLKLCEGILYHINNVGMVKALQSAGDWCKLLSLELHGSFMGPRQT